MIRQKLETIRANIGRICRKTGRDPSEITLVAATKYATIPQIRAAIEAGLTDIGESKVQDAREKFTLLGPEIKGLRKHMIGHLQTNKVKAALEIFDLIQSIDSAKLAAEIEKRAAELGREVQVLIEVNLSGERQKFGTARDEVFSVVDAIQQCPHVVLRGLMTIAPYTGDEHLVRNCFRELKVLSDQIRTKYRDGPRIRMQYLSMGMTHDYEIALEEGANMIRIGSALFGPDK